MKQRISDRGPQFGCWIEMFSPIAAGYELIIVDADVLLLRDGAQASLAKLRSEI